MYVVLDGLYKYTVSWNRCRKSHILLKGAKEILPCFPHFRPIFTKYGSEYIHNNILPDCELRESRFSEKNCLLYLEAEINFYPKISHFLPDSGAIPYWTLPMIMLIVCELLESSWRADRMCSWFWMTAVHIGVYLKPYDTLKVKNVLVMSAYSATRYTICSIVICIIPVQLSGNFRVLLENMRGPW
jgi:hypothetical protein